MGSGRPRGRTLTDRTPLARPRFPTNLTPLRAERTVAVFGRDASRFAEALAASLHGALLRVELRHASGWSHEGTILHAHPASLRRALEAIVGAPRAEWIVGVGAVFAAAIEPDCAVWIREPRGEIMLDPTLRPVAQRAELVLDEPRVSTADALGLALEAVVTAR